MVAGFRTDAGKTVCARALVRGVIDRGFRVTAEKKSGTACCRDWLTCFEAGYDGVSESPAAEIRFCPESHPGRDFVDGLGIASDVSVDPRTFAEEGCLYTDAILGRTKPDFHVMELADSIAHSSNMALLLESSFSSKLGAVIYCPYPCMETAFHAVHFIRSRLELLDVPLILSGPLANEGQYAMYRSELGERLSIPIVPCAWPNGEGWRSQGSELADRVLSLRPASRAGGPRRERP